MAGNRGNRRRAVEIMLDVLRDEGATTIFGNPASTEMPFMDALVDASDFRYILGLQEATAVAMADGYALKTARPALVNLHAAGGPAMRWACSSHRKRARRRSSSLPDSRTRVTSSRRRFPGTGEIDGRAVLSG
jgi:hypothetical protein